MHEIRLERFASPHGHTASQKKQCWVLRAERCDCRDMTDSSRTKCTRKDLFSFFTTLDDQNVLGKKWLKFDVYWKQIHWKLLLKRACLCCERSIWIYSQYLPKINRIMWSDSGLLKRFVYKSKSFAYRTDVLSHLEGKAIFESYIKSSSISWALYWHKLSVQFIHFDMECCQRRRIAKIRPRI